MATVSLNELIAELTAAVRAAQEKTQAWYEQPPVGLGYSDWYTVMTKLPAYELENATEEQRRALYGLVSDTWCDQDRPHPTVREILDALIDQLPERSAI